MKQTAWFLILASMIFAAGRSAGAADARLEIARLDDDGMLMMNGKRTFVFGCYHNPGTTEGLAELKQAGFNLVSAKAERAALDQVAAQGLCAWIPLGGTIAPADAAGEKALEDTVRSLGDHRALAAWEIPDEALWNEWYNRSNALEAERGKRGEVLREREKAGADPTRAKALIAEENVARARADFASAEALDREIRILIGAPEPNPDIQLSRAPEAAEKLRMRLLRGYEIIHRIDARPVWMNYAPRNTMPDLRRYAEAADIVGCDIYPVPMHPNQGHSDLVNKQPSSVGDYTRRFREAGDGRAVWMVLQGFGWRDLHGATPDALPDQGRRPTQAESRFMMYDAIANGARGVLYWGTDYARKPPEFWSELRAVVREAAELSEVWSARDAKVQPRVPIEPTWGSVDRPPVVLAKDVDCKLHVLVVNEHTEALGVRLEGLQGFDCATVRLVGPSHGCALGRNRALEDAVVVFMPAQSAAVVMFEK